MTETWTATALERLRSTSGRSGTARRAVIEFLGRQDCCLSAQEIHDAVRTAGVHVGLASVYRALEGLDRGGLVQRIDLGDGISRFEPALADGEHHHHFVCDDCGKVEAFEDSALEAALEKIAGGKGYALEAHDVVLRGGCGECRTGAA